jgi:sterol desaturase/sphingolipid hydroxylase (fatty acid hydroxylase superfamily)
MAHKHAAGDEPERFLDKPKNVDRIWYALVATCVLLLLLEFAYHKHTHFEFEGWFGFYPFYGFIVFIFVVMVGKQLRKILMRGEDYYDR